MVGDKIAQQVERCLPQRGEARVRRRLEVSPGQAGHLGEERPAELVVLQRAVPARTPDRAAATAAEEGLSRDAGDGHDSVVDLIARDRGAVRGAGRTAEDLGLTEGD